MLGKELKRNILKSKTENKAEKKGKARKTKLPSLKNQIRGVQRLLAKVRTVTDEFQACKATDLQFHLF